MTTTDPALIEPLARLAWLAWEQATTLCHPELGCCDYHRCWTLVRWLNQDGALPANNPFYARQLGTLARQGRTRVLISGAADSGLLAMVVAAYRQHGVTPDIVLVDQCPTPILQCREYADQLSLTVEFLEQDVRNLDIKPVDAVVAHSFLHFFSAESRLAVAASWRSLLKPDGSLILSNSLADTASSGPPARLLADIVNQADKLVDKARSRGFNPDETSALRATLIRFWQQNNWRQPYITEASLRELLAATGFDIEQCLVDTSPGAAPSRSFDRSSPRHRAQILARAC